MHVRFMQTDMLKQYRIKPWKHLTFFLFVLLRCHLQEQETMWNFCLKEIEVRKFKGWRLKICSKILEVFVKGCDNTIFKLNKFEKFKGTTRSLNKRNNFLSINILVAPLKSLLNIKILVSTTWIFFFSFNLRPFFPLIFSHLFQESFTMHQIIFSLTSWLSSTRHAIAVDISIIIFLQIFQFCLRSRKIKL